MGICSSCESTSIATAKLILQDGRLQEFSYPVKVSYLLQRNPSCFICDSDEMEFDDVVSAVRDDEELQPGQLYFALPLSKLRHRLQPEEMAALAVKASSALMRSGGGDRCGCRRKGLVPVVPCGDKSPSAGENGGRRRSNRSNGRRRTMLSAIPE